MPRKSDVQVKPAAEYVVFNPDSAVAAVWYDIVEFNVPLDTMCAGGAADAGGSSI